jgi:hypothetical protein
LTAAQLPHYLGALGWRHAAQVQVQMLAAVRAAFIVTAGRRAVSKGM